MAVKPLPSIAVLRQVLLCVPEEGRLFWLKRDRSHFTSDRIHKSWNSRYAGQEAMTSVIKVGYRLGSLFDSKLYAHRVIFAMCHARWPVGEIDHIDGDKLNNRISNLREATSRENKRNMKQRCDNVSGHMGVHQHPNRRWRAVIGVDCEVVHLGYFPTQDAAAARKAAEKKYGFHTNHGRAA